MARGRKGDFGEEAADTHGEQPCAKKLVTATGAQNYNLLQNNGRAAHQEVDHVHLHMVRPCLPRRLSPTCIVERQALTGRQIPKPNEQEGLSMSWPAQKTDMDRLKRLFEEVKSMM